MGSYRAPEPARKPPDVRTIKCESTWPPKAPPKLPMVRMASKPRDVLNVASPAPQASKRMPGASMWRNIVAEVCRKHGTTIYEIIGQQRGRGIVLARHEAFYRLATETTMSMTQIGRHLGDRDHTTVLAGVRRHKERNGL